MSVVNVPANVCRPSYKKQSFLLRVKKNKFLLFLFLPGFLHFLIFRYAPMFGIVIAFQDYNIFDGFLHSQWVGLKHFRSFIGGLYFEKVMLNTILISLYSIIFCFPVPIIFAVLLNEIRNNAFKRCVQTISYLPHFISTVIIVGMLIDFLSPETGVISNLIANITNTEPTFFMAEPKYFKTIYILREIWTETGWGAIIYIASIAGIDPCLYEAAVVDGANRWHRIIHVTIPSIMPTIIVMLIMRMGYVLEVGFEGVYLMQNSLNYDSSEVLATFIFRRGLGGDGGVPEYSFGTAVNLFKSLIGLCMVIGTNKICRKLSETSLW